MVQQSIIWHDALTHILCNQTSYQYVFRRQKSSLKKSPVLICPTDYGLISSEN